MTKLDWAKANRAEMPKVARPKTQTQKRQEAVAKAYANGTDRERERILHLANSLICFEHHKGCEHAACYAMSNLIGYIKEGNK